MLLFLEGSLLRERTLDKPPSVTRRELLPHSSTQQYKHMLRRNPNTIMMMIPLFGFVCYCALVVARVMSVCAAAAAATSADDNGADAQDDAAGEAFLQANRDKPGVVELDSGLQYKILTNGTGLYHPREYCQCQCHYEGRLAALNHNGHVFDSSYERGEPLQVSPMQVMEGWNQAMQRMVAGDVWELYIPAALAYGAMGHAPDIPPHAVLWFELHLVTVDCPAQHRTLALKCRVDTGALCNDRELAYRDKIANDSWPASKIVAELSRIGGIVQDNEQAVTPLKEELLEWLLRRQYILQHFVTQATTTTATSDDEEKEEEENDEL